jgi:DNA mismatch repair protein MSH6
MQAREEVQVDQEDQAPLGGGFASLDEILHALPEFLKPNAIQDAHGRRPDDEEYDDTSLLVPAGAWKDFTPAMSQYWAIKQYNLEKILFFKLGKFYEIFYHDAIVCQRLLDLNWMGGAKKLHVGFPERALDKYLALLVK